MWTYFEKCQSCDNSDSGLFECQPYLKTLNEILVHLHISYGNVAISVFLTEPTTNGFNQWRKWTTDIQAYLRYAWMCNSCWKELNKFGGTRVRHHTIPCGHQCLLPPISRYDDGELGFSGATIFAERTNSAQVPVHIGMLDWCEEWSGLRRDMRRNPWTPLHVTRGWGWILISVCGNAGQ